MAGLELITEISYQTQSHNIHFKITGLVRRFLRRNVSSNRIHCCYIILTKTKECRGKKVCPFLLENSRPLPPWEPWTTFFSSGTLDFLSTHFRIDSLNFNDPPLRVMEIKAKINKWDLIKLKNLCTMKETINKAAFRMGENNSKLNNWQRIHLQNIQAAYAAQFQKSKQWNNKNGPKN